MADLTASERIKAHARDLGFDLVGVATAEPFTQDEPRIVEWLRGGMNAGMAWMTEARAALSCHPDELLPGAASLIVVGTSYRGQLPRPDDDQPRGHVARYARGADYHDVLKARLDLLAGYVREVGGEGARTRVFVDSSPLPERAAAIRAGLGFVGKNTNLLTSQAGSWLLLGALLTTLRLDPDGPMLKDCGQCRLCLDACPTGALPEPFALDANRCISYLTIEHRGIVPVELRSAIGSNVFGCDICQDVCPWNRADRGPGWSEFHGDADAARPPLEALMALDDEAFRARYRRTPIWRTKRRGLLRNAAIALGNVGDASALPVLTAALADHEPLVRAHAAWAIGQIGDPGGRDPLLTARSHETNLDVQVEIDQALAALAAEDFTT